MRSENMLICPLCKASLAAEGRSFYCTGEKRHCYDTASSGYVNLLPPGKKSNAKTGDDKEMLRCRRAFLSEGHYDPISEAAAKEALSVLGQRDTLSFVDAGCGDGYHALNIEKYYKGLGIDCYGVGLEASKHGAEAAAKLARREGRSAFFAAANIFDMPLSDKSCDIVFSMFAPVPDSEALRVLKDDGVLLVCSSGSRHLWEMREVIYGEPRLSEPLSRVPEGFRLMKKASLEYSFTLDSKESIASLFTMTPFYYRCPKEGRERLLSLESLTVRAETEYKVYVKADNKE